MKIHYLLILLFTFTFSQNKLFSKDYSSPLHKDKIVSFQDCDDNFLQNGGFENGLNGWNVVGNVSLSTQAHLGSNAAEIKSGFNRIYQFLPATEGVTYTASAQLSGNGSGIIGIKFLDANWQPNNELSTVSVTSNYEEFELTKTAPAGAAWVEISIYSSFNGDLFVDEVCLTDESVTPPPSQEAKLEIVEVPCPETFPALFEPYTVNPTIKNLGNATSTPQRVYLMNNRPNSTASIADTEIPALAPGEEITVELSTTLQATMLPPDSYYREPKETTNFYLSLNNPILGSPTNDAEIPFYCQTYNTNIKVEFDSSFFYEYDDSGDLYSDILIKNTGSETAYNVKVITLEDVEITDFNRVNEIYLGYELIRLYKEEGLMGLIPKLEPGQTKRFPILYKLLGPGQFSTLPDKYEIKARLIHEGQNLNNNVDDDSASLVFKRKGSNPPSNEGNLVLTATGDDIIKEWKTGNFIFEVRNTGNETFTDVKVDLDFDANIQLVGGNEYTSSIGTSLTNFWTIDPTWNIGTIAPGETKNLTLNIFSISNNPLAIYGQISQANGNDVTSTPGNGTPPRVNEDDEARWLTNYNPDFQISNINLTNTPLEGRTVTYDYEVTNTGTRPYSDAISFKTYISNDPIISPDDYQGGGSDYSGLNLLIGSSILLSKETPINGLSAGDYYLIVKADSRDNIEELYETNNTRAIPFTIGGGSGLPDLRAFNFNFTSNDIIAGERVNYNFEISNLGNAPIPNNFSTKIYISSDDMISSDDFQGGTLLTGNFAAGLSTKRISSSIVIPSYLTTGNYYFLLELDFDNQIEEQNENNNFLAALFPVTSNGANSVDLEIYQVNIFQTIFKEGDPISNNYGIRNNGTDDSGAFTHGMYLSTDQIFSPDDLDLSLNGQNRSPNFTGGRVFQTAVSTTTFPSVPAGEYYILVVADSENEVIEYNEFNNTFSTKINVESSTNPTPTCDNNLLLNPGFEDGLDNWEIIDPGGIDITADINSGNNALKLLGNEAVALSQTIPAEPGVTYRLTFWGKKERGYSPVNWCCKRDSQWK